jgi:hypothetical protein
VVAQVVEDAFVAHLNDVAPAHHQFAGRGAVVQYLGARTARIAHEGKARPPGLGEAAVQAESAIAVSERAHEHGLGIGRGIDALRVQRQRLRTFKMQCGS